MDALGLPVRFAITPGHWADSPQAEGLIRDLAGVGHVIADAGYDTDALRRFIADDLQATAQIKRNRSRAGNRPLDRERFSLGIWWIGFRMNQSGSDVQILQMYS